MLYVSIILRVCVDTFAMTLPSSPLDREMRY